MSSLRLPQSFARRLGVETGEAVLRYELIEEQAVSLGRMGRKAEAALAALRAHEGEGRAEVLKAACDAVWCFLVSARCWAFAIAPPSCATTTSRAR